MLAARAYEGETKFRLEDVERPLASAGDVVVKVEAAGLTNGLLGLWKRGMFPVLPRTLGHEAAGVVAEIGAGVSGVSVGDRVRIHPGLSCRNCEYCLNDREQFCVQSCFVGHGIFGPEAMPLYMRYLDGALAEFVKVPGWAVDLIPPEMTFEVAAKLHDVADGLRALKSAQLKPGATIVVTAATGVLGSSLVRLAPKFGVDRLIAVGRSADRLRQTQGLQPGLTEIIALEEIGSDWEARGGLTAAIRQAVPSGPDAVFDFFDRGAGTWQAVASLKQGGTAVLMAPNAERPPIPTAAFVINGWHIVGTRGCTRADTHQVMSWLENDTLRIDDLITHRFDLREIDAATTVVRERREPTRMVVVYPGPNGQGADTSRSG